MPNLGSHLELERCPHCEVRKPNLTRQTPPIETDAYSGGNPRSWNTYACSFCGGVVLAWAVKGGSSEVKEWFPTSNGVDEAIPGRAREYLKQARETLHAPAGSIMLFASAVDAMLKAKE